MGIAALKTDYFDESIEKDIDIKQLLSARETEVSRLAYMGMSNKEIAQVLDISPHTVSSHLRVVFSKLGITKRTALSRFMSVWNLEAR